MHALNIKGLTKSLQNNRCIKTVFREPQHIQNRQRYQMI